MNFDILWRCLMAVPGLLIPGFNLDSVGWGGQPPAHRPSATTRHDTTSPRPSPPAQASATPMPYPAGTPAATTAPARAGQPIAAAAEVATEQVCPGQANVAQTAAVLTCLTAHARRFHGLTATIASGTLMAAAGAKAGDMRTCGYGHTACGRAANYWLAAKGYAGRCSGENIAAGQRSPREVFIAWMSSPGHRANILNPSYRDLGVAETSGPNGPLWVMELGGC